MKMVGRECCSHEVLNLAVESDDLVRWLGTSRSAFLMCQIPNGLDVIISDENFS